jgi:transposase-like protein
MHGHCRRSDRGLVSAALREIFDAESLEAARPRLGEVLERFRAPLPKLAELLEVAEDALLAFYRFPRSHWSKLRSTNPLERPTTRSAVDLTSSGSFPTTPPRSA